MKGKVERGLQVSSLCIKVAVETLVSQKNPKSYQRRDGKKKDAFSGRKKNGRDSLTTEMETRGPNEK